MRWYYWLALLAVPAYGHTNQFFVSADYSQPATDIYAVQEDCVQWVVDQLLIPVGDTNRVSPGAHRRLHANELNLTIDSMVWEGATRSNIVSLAKYCRPMMTKQSWSGTNDVRVRKLIGTKFRLAKKDGDTGGLQSYAEPLNIPDYASKKKRIRSKIRRIMGEDWGFVPHKMSPLGQKYKLLQNRKEALGQDWHLDDEYVQDLYKFWRSVKRVLISRR